MKKIVKGLLLSVMMAGLVFSSVMTSGIIADETGDVRATNEIQLINGDFEEPAINWAEIPRGYDWVNANNVPGWSTTDTKNEIEFFTRYSGVTAPSGTQFVELNAHSKGELFQVVATAPGTRMRWSLAHRGRDKTDTMVVNIGAPGSAVQVARLETARTGWKYYTGTYTVPVGQEETYFGFATLVSSSATTGNLMDDLRFATMADVGVEKFVSQENAIYGDVLTYSLNLANYGGTDAKISELTDVIPNGTEYVPGTLNADGSAQTDAKDSDFMDYNSGTNTVTLNDAVVKAGETYQVTFQAKVTQLQASVISNVAALKYQDYYGGTEQTEIFEADSNTVTTNTSIKRSSITVKYEDMDGNTLLADKVNQYDAGYIYSEAPEVIPGYTYSTTEGTASGILGGEDVVIKFIYAQTPATIQLRHVDGATGVSLIPDEAIPGFVGDQYSSSIAQITNYHVSVIPGNAFGRYLENPNPDIVYQYELIPSDGVLVLHLDEDGKEIAVADELHGVIGMPFMTQEKTIYGYNVKTKPNPEGGTFSAELQTLTYVYERVVSPGVNVVYQDEAGNPIRNSVVIYGLINNSYKSIAYTIPGYTLNTIPVNAHGRLSDTLQTVVYEYRRSDAAPVIVHYVSTTGEELSPPVTLDGLVGEPYTASGVDIYGYDLTAKPGNAIGTFSEEEQNVYYVYQREVAKVVNVEYVDETGDILSRPSTKRGLVNDPYATIGLTVYGYEIVAEPGNATGVFTDQEQTVTYVYHRLAGAEVTVEYIDTEGNVLASEVKLNGFLYQIYTTEAASVPGYEVISAPESEEGHFTADEQKVTYVYQRSQAAAVRVQYVDEGGRSIVPDTYLNGLINDAYTAVPQELVTYELVKRPDNEKGTFTALPQVVTYVYRIKDTGEIGTTPTGDPGGVSTGDTTNIGMYASLALLSFAFLIATIKRKSSEK